MRRSDEFLAVAGLLAALVGLTLVEAALHRSDQRGHDASRAMVRRLGLTDREAHAAWRVLVTRALARLPEQFSGADDPALAQEVRKALRGG